MSAILDLPEIRSRVHLWTVREYEKLEDNPAFRYVELIRGIIVEKLPRTPLHSFLTKKLYDLFMRVSAGGFLVRKEEPLRLADSMPEPDVAIVRGNEDDFRSRHPSTASLAVEVAISSVASDRENATLYAEAGVTEYWIVLSEKEQVEVYREPENGVYKTKRIYSLGEAIEEIAVTEQSVLVETLFS